MTDMPDGMEEVLEMIGNDMPAVLVTPEEVEKFIEQFDANGYDLACVSNAGTPPGMFRLTFLKKEHIRSEK